MLCLGDVIGVSFDLINLSMLCVWLIRYWTTARLYSTYFHHPCLVAPEHSPYSMQSHVLFCVESLVLEVATVQLGLIM